MSQKPRTVHPSDAQDERLAALPLSAVHTYTHLPTVLDDEGRAKDQPAVLNGYLWPLRADEHPTAAMEADLAGLSGEGLLCRYAVGGAAYVHDPRWKARQKVSRPAPSEIPACPEHDRSFDEAIGETLGRFADQVNAFVGAAADKMAGGKIGGIDEAKVRDAFARVVEDVTYLVDPEKASAYGQKVRGLFTKVTASDRGYSWSAHTFGDDGPGSGDTGSGDGGSGDTGPGDGGVPGGGGKTF